MSQNDFVIENQTAAIFRQDLNDALQALASQSSGDTAPSTTYPNMIWYQPSTSTLKQRTNADDGWIDVGYFNQSTGAFALFENTDVVDASGNVVGIIGSQDSSSWTAGLGTTESLISPAKLKSAILQVLTDEGLI